MLDWIKNINKEHPEFWKNYLSKFEKKSQRYVSLSITSTGTNPEKDVILSLSKTSNGQERRVQTYLVSNLMTALQK